MNKTTTGGSRARDTAIGALAACLLAAAGLPAQAQTASAPEAKAKPDVTGSPASDAAAKPKAAKPAAKPATAPGMRVYIDPATGRFLPEPPPGQPPAQYDPQTMNAMSTSHDGLVEVPNTGPGGGFRLDLQGRFQSPITATIDAKGKVKVDHPAERPVTKNEKKD